MKKLIALFAILVAMTSFSFAATGSATATVNVYAPTTCTVTVDHASLNVLTGGSVTFNFSAALTYDAAWLGSLSGAWSYSSTNVYGTWGTPSELGLSASSGSGSDGASVTYNAGSTGGGVSDTFTATYTFNYVSF